MKFDQWSSSFQSGSKRCSKIYKWCCILISIHGEWELPDIHLFFFHKVVHKKWSNIYVCSWIDNELIVLAHTKYAFNWWFKSFLWCVGIVLKLGDTCCTCCIQTHLISVSCTLKRSTAICLWSHYICGLLTWHSWVMLVTCTLVAVDIWNHKPVRTCVKYYIYWSLCSSHQ